MRKTLLTVRLLLGLAFFGTLFCTLFCTLLQVGSVSAEEAGSLSEANDPLIVHEWGTWTSFSGSNGVQLEFRPLHDAGLPMFVLDRSDFNPTGKPRSSLAKSATVARYRMETPVTYFYTKSERTVNVRVDFPEGMLTEFYPPVVAMSPPYVNGKEKIGNSSLDWGKVRLIPLSCLRPPLQDAAEADFLQQRIAQSLVPPVYAATHYQFARETDSALVHVQFPASKGVARSDYLEKFLFYRGLGKFQLPLQVTVNDEGAVTVANRGELPFQSLFLIKVDDKNVTLARAASLKGGEQTTIPAPTENVTIETLQKLMQEALIEAGLYEKEAVAMVATWQDSWFQETGTRLFYLVPQAMTDRLLPLHITPTPQTTVRVMVGRAEVMSPTVEKGLLDVLTKSAELRLKRFKETGRMTFGPVPPEFEKLGRLSEPALARIQELAKDPRVAGEAESLLGLVRHQHANQP